MTCTCSLLSRRRPACVQSVEVRVRPTWRVVPEIARRSVPGDLEASSKPGCSDRNDACYKCTALADGAAVYSSAPQKSAQNTTLCYVHQRDVFVVMQVGHQWQPLLHQLWRCASSNSRSCRSATKSAVAARGLR